MMIHSFAHPLGAQATEPKKTYYKSTYTHKGNTTSYANCEGGAHYSKAATKTTHCTIATNR
eukprot:11813028-Ditylum_brightwellii.AAC.1